MHQLERDPTIVAAILGDEQPPQRRLPHVEAMVRGVEAAAQLVDDVAVVLVEADVLGDQLGALEHHLNRLGQAFADEGGAQDVVAIDHGLQRADVALEAIAAVEGHQLGGEVDVTLGLHLMVEQHAGLQRRERIDVAHVGGASWHRGHDRGKFAFAQRDQ